MRSVAIFCALGAVALANPPEKPLPTFRSEPAAVELSDDTQPLIKRAVDALRKGDVANARAELEQVLKVAPNNAVALLNLGVVAYRQKRLEEAETLLAKAVHSDPDLAQGWLILGVVRQDRDELDASLAALAQAAWLDPKNARAHHYLGVTIGRKGWYSGAEEEMRKALELQPDYQEAHFNLAVFYLQRNPPAVELARRHYQKSLDLGGAPDAEVAHALGE
jgi:Flp pilus assembly protein TadD